MRVIGATVLAAVLMAAQPAPAQVLDLSNVKCKEFVESGEQTIGLIVMWLDGYFTDEESEPVIDFDKMKGKGQKLGAFCAANPAEDLVKAAEDIFRAD